MGQLQASLRGSDDVMIKKALDQISEEQYGKARAYIIDSGVESEDQLANDLEAAKLAIDNIHQGLRDAIVAMIEGEEFPE